jgi:hypothetical protein
MWTRASTAGYAFADTSYRKVATQHPRQVKVTQLSGIGEKAFGLVESFPGYVDSGVYWLQDGALFALSAESKSQSYLTTAEGAAKAIAGRL